MEVTPSAISVSWGWVGLEPVEVNATSAFGNVIVLDAAGRYWRICPEELSCEVIAENAEAFNALCHDPDFLVDWEAEALVVLARATVGPLTEHRCYCLKIPAALGGKYAAENLGTVPLAELIAFSGDVAKQLRSVPDGTQVRFVFK